MTWMYEVLELPDPQDPRAPGADGPLSRPRQLHGARAGGMAHAATGRRDDPLLTQECRHDGSAVLQRRDARARGHASHSACVSTRRADAGSAAGRQQALKFSEEIQHENNRVIWSGARGVRAGDDGAGAVGVQVELPDRASGGITEGRPRPGRLRCEHLPVVPITGPP